MPSEYYDVSEGAILRAGMTEDIDIWRPANLPVKQLGEDVTLAASRRVDEMLTAATLMARLFLERILNAVEELQRMSLRSEEQRH